MNPSHYPQYKIRYTKYRPFWAFWLTLDRYYIVEYSLYWSRRSFSLTRGEFKLRHRTVEKCNTPEEAKIALYKWSMNRDVYETAEQPTRKIGIKK